MALGICYRRPNTTSRRSERGDEGWSSGQLASGQAASGERGESGSCILYLDSLGGKKDLAIELLQSYLNAEWLFKGRNAPAASEAVAVEGTTAEGATADEALPSCGDAIELQFDATPNTKRQRLQDNSAASTGGVAVASDLAEGAGGAPVTSNCGAAGTQQNLCTSPPAPEPACVRGGDSAYFARCDALPAATHPTRDLSEYAPLDQFKGMLCKGVAALPQQKNHVDCGTHLPLPPLPQPPPPTPHCSHPSHVSWPWALELACVHVLVACPPHAGPACQHHMPAPDLRTPPSE